MATSDVEDPGAAGRKSMALEVERLTMLRGSAAGRQSMALGLGVEGRTRVSGSSVSYQLSGTIAMLLLQPALTWTSLESLIRP